MRTAQSPIEQANGDPWLYSDQKIGLVNLENVLQVPDRHLVHIVLVTNMHNEQTATSYILSLYPRLCWLINIIIIIITLYILSLSSSQTNKCKKSKRCN